MKTYWLIFLTDLQNNLVYRFSFLIQHFRQFLAFLVPLFVWTAVFQHQTSIYHYSFSLLMTYVFVSLVLRTLVFNSTTYELASIINNGYLSVYLLKPINIFKYYLARDLSTKFVNSLFLFLEIPLLLFLFKPPLIFQTDPFLIIAFVLSVILAIGLYFYISFIFGTIGFWSHDVWAPRFLFLIILEFATGSIFPLDMLPSQAYHFLQAMPFAYLVFSPLQIYLGKSSHPWLDLGIAFLWLLFFYVLANLIWQKGLKTYEAEGY